MAKLTGAISGNSTPPGRRSLETTSSAILFLNTRAVLTAREGKASASLAAGSSQRRGAASLSQRPEDVSRAALVCLDHLPLDVVVDVRLLGRHKDGSAVDALRTERERSSETATVTDAARGDVRGLELARGESELNARKERPE